MQETNIILPSKPKIISEEGNKGVYEIEGLYPGYGQTLGNSLRRIILSSLPGAAITSIKIEGVPHEFSTVAGVKEDVIAIILNLKRIRFKVLTDESVHATIKVSGIKEVTSDDIKLPGQAELLTPKLHIADITDKGTTLEIELTIEQGLGYVPKEALHKDKVEIGTIALDAAFTPVRRANYEVEQMRVGTRTDYNRLRLMIETDGTVTPHEALKRSIEIMITQLKSIVGFKETEVETPAQAEVTTDEKPEVSDDPAKTKIDNLNLSTRTTRALTEAGVRTVGGLSRKHEDDLRGIEGLGDKGIAEIKKALGNFGLTLKE